MSTTVVKWISWPSLFVVLLLAAWFTVESLEERHEPAPPDEATADRQVSDERLAHRHNELSIEESTGAHELNVADSCHSVFDSTPECFATLEVRYLDEPADRWRPEPILAVSKPLTWREVFSSPKDTRVASAIALSDRECHIPNGRIRNDLRSSCAADEIATLAVLHQTCIAALRDDATRDITDLEREWDFEIARLDREALDQADYYRRREGLEDQWYWLSWRLSKCRTVPAEALVFIGALMSPSADSQDERRFPHGQTFELMAAAARLGSEWAQAYYLGDAAHINALAQFDVGRAYANLARRYHGGTHEQLAYEIAAAKHALRQGIPAHRIRLDLSRYSPEVLSQASAKAEWIVSRGWTREN